MDRQNITFLEHSPYKVSWKADGTRWVCCPRMSTQASHTSQKGPGTTNRDDFVELVSLTYTFQERCHYCSKACFPKSCWVVKMDFWRSSGEALWLSLAQMCSWIFNDCSQFKDPTYWCFSFLSDWKKNSRVQFWPTKLQQLCGVCLRKCQYFKVSSLVNAESDSTLYPL